VIGHFKGYGPNTSFPAPLLSRRLHRNLRAVAEPGARAWLYRKWIWIQSRGVTGQNHCIDYSTNLSVWTPLTTNTLGSDLLIYTGREGTNSAYRFYSLRWK